MDTPNPTDSQPVPRPDRHGRPCLPPESKAAWQRTVRATPAVGDLIEGAASRRGLSVSEYLRTVAERDARSES
jgi:hypothetical protein